MEDRQIINLKESLEEFRIIFGYLGNNDCSAKISHIVSYIDYIININNTVNRHINEMRNKNELPDK